MNDPSLYPSIGRSSENMTDEAIATNPNLYNQSYPLKCNLCGHSLQQSIQLSTQKHLHSPFNSQSNIHHEYYYPNDTCLVNKKKLEEECQYYPSLMRHTQNECFEKKGKGDFDDDKQRLFVLMHLEECCPDLHPLEFKRTMNQGSKHEIEAMKSIIGKRMHHICSTCFHKS